MCSARPYAANALSPIISESVGCGKTVRIRSSSVASSLRAISRGTEASLERVRGVERAIVGLFGSPYEPELRARLDVAANADLTQVRSNVDAALERLATTTGMPPRSADITLRLVEGQQARVS